MVPFLPPTHSVASRRTFLFIYSLPSSLASQAIEALRIEFLEANPQYDAGRLLVVANTARTIDR